MLSQECEAALGRGRLASRIEGCLFCFQAGHRRSNCFRRKGAVRHRRRFLRKVPRIMSILLNNRGDDVMLGEHSDVVLGPDMQVNDCEQKSVDDTVVTESIERVVDIVTVRTCGSLRISVGLGGNIFSALLDSGAGTSCLNANLVQHMQLDPVEVVLRTADNSILNAVGTVSGLRVMIQNVIFPTDFVIVEGLAVQCILGTSFCKQYGVVIDYKQEEVSISSEHARVVVPFVGSTATCAAVVQDVEPDALEMVCDTPEMHDRECRVPETSELLPEGSGVGGEVFLGEFALEPECLQLVASEEVVIPPNGGRCDLNFVVKGGIITETSLFEPRLSWFEQKGLVIPAGVLSGVEGGVISVVNISIMPVCVYKHDILGSVSDCDVIPMGGAEVLTEEKKAAIINANEQPLVEQDISTGDVGVIVAVTQSLTDKRDLLSPGAEHMGAVRMQTSADGRVLTEIAEDEMAEPTVLASVMECDVMARVDELNVNTALPPQQRAALRALLVEFQDVFCWSPNQIGCANIGECDIELKDPTPVKLQPYRVSSVERLAIKEHLDEMLAAGIISPSNSEWSSPMVMVKKKNGKLRLVVDFRKVNLKIKKNGYPSPNADELLGCLEGCKVFTSLDLHSGFWQLRLTERAREVCSFATCMGLYSFNRLPFGIATAPGLFSSAMDRVLSDLKYSHCLIYLDDVLVPGKDFEDHLNKLRLVLERFRKANMTLNPSKCSFGFFEIAILGHVVNAMGVSPNPDTVKAIRDFPTPKKLKQLRSFVGLASYFRNYVQGFSQISLPLTSLCKKNVKFTWGVEQEQAFRTLQEKLTSAPVLRHYDENAPIQIRADASLNGLGAIILQQFDGNWYPLSYQSRRLSISEKNYTISELELLAVVFALKKFRHYIFGKRFQVYTDHHSLCYLRKNNDKNSRLARWAIFIFAHDMEIIYKSGSKHLDADCLSRLVPEDGPDVEDDVDEELEIMTMAIQVDGLAQAQADDAKLVELIQALNNPDQATSRVRRQSRSYVIENGVLYRKNFVPNGPSKLLVIPDKLKPEVINQAHDSLGGGGHLGFAKTYLKLKSRVFWEGMNVEVEKYVRTCRECQVRKSPRMKGAGLLQPVPVGRCFDCVAVDLVGPLPVTEKGKNRFIITATDYATKWAIARPLPTGSAKDVADFLLTDLICIHGCPRRILSDRGGVFRGKVITEILKGLGVESVFASSYNPQCLGLCEHYNGTLKTMLSFFVNKYHSNWEDFVGPCTFSYNVSIQNATNQSPFFLVYGREATLPLDAGLQPALQLGVDSAERVARLQEAREKVAVLIREEQARQKRIYDGKHRHVEYSVGDLVLVFFPRRKVGLVEKFLQKWDGPYEVLEKLSDVNYKVRIKLHNKVTDDIIHVKRMKPFYDR